MADQQGTHGRPFTGWTVRSQRLVTRVHVWAFQLSGGRVGKRIVGAPVLLLTTIGRKSGQLRTTPLTYGRDGDDFVLVASNGGTTSDPLWWRNLKANPHALVQIGDLRFPGVARAATASERERLWPRMVELYAGYADYQVRTDRTIPVVLVRPAVK